jgi:hypothetical protein
MGTQSKHLDDRVPEGDPGDDEILELVDVIIDDDEILELVDIVVDDEDILELTDAIEEDKADVIDRPDIGQKDTDTKVGLLDPDWWETDDATVSKTDHMPEIMNLKGVEEDLIDLTDGMEESDKEIVIEEINSSLPGFSWDLESGNKTDVEEDSPPERFEIPEDHMNEESAIPMPEIKESSPPISDLTRKMLESLESPLSAVPVSSGEGTDPPKEISTPDVNQLLPASSEVPCEPAELSSHLEPSYEKQEVSLTEEQVESALERVIRRMFQKKIEDALEQAVDRVVREDMQYLKKLIMEENGNP